MTHRVVDPGRLLRALTLEVSASDGDTYQVTGGMEPHIVRVHDGESWTCDCVDAQYHPEARCKHLISVYLVRQLAVPVRLALRQAVRQDSKGEHHAAACK